MMLSLCARLGGLGTAHHRPTRPLLHPAPRRSLCAHASARVGAALPLLNALEAGKRQQIDAYVATLLEWNGRMNLVAASQASREQILERHVEDALALLPVITQALGPEASESVSLVDVGSGAGFPGMVLAIARPQWRVTLMDSLAKRVKFLDTVAQRVPVSNVQTLWARSEDAGHDRGHRELYDIAVARAVAELRVLAELCLPLVRVGGLWVAAKGADAEAELAPAIRAVALLGGGELAVRPVTTLGPDGRPFCAVLCTKQRRTPIAYPRSSGTPKHSPLA